MNLCSQEKEYYMLPSLKYSHMGSPCVFSLGLASQKTDNYFLKILQGHNYQHGIPISKGEGVLRNNKDYELQPWLNHNPANENWGNPFAFLMPFLWAICKAWIVCLPNILLQSKKASFKLLIMFSSSFT